VAVKPIPIERRTNLAGSLCVSRLRDVRDCAGAADIDRVDVRPPSHHGRFQPPLPRVAEFDDVLTPDIF
jgi:hypothetical protein